MSGARELLSKDEVDTLLQGVEQGRVGTAGAAAPAGEVRLYDFSGREAHVPELPELAAVNERLVRQLSAPLSLFFGCPVECGAGKHRTVRLAEYIAGLPNPSSFNVVRAKPIDCDCVVAFDATFISAAVNQFFGGDARFPTDLERDSLTPTEQNLAERVIGLLLAEVKDAWAPALGLEFAFVRNEPDLHSVTGLAPGEALLVTVLEVKLQERTGQIHIGLTATALEALREKLHGGAGQPAKGANWKARLREALEEMRVRAGCTLLETAVSLGSVMQLKAGDVIPVALPSRVILRIEGTPVFYGHYGASRGAHAVKTTHAVPKAPR